MTRKSHYIWAPNIVAMGGVGLAESRKLQVVEVKSENLPFG